MLIILVGVVPIGYNLVLALTRMSFRLVLRFVATRGFELNMSDRVGSFRIRCQ